MAGSQARREVIAAVLACGVIVCTPPPPAPLCGDPLVVGVWSASPFAPPVTITVADRHVWWTRRVTPSIEARRWYLPSGAGGRCQRTVVRYAPASGSPVAFATRFGREGF